MKGLFTEAEGLWSKASVVAVKALPALNSWNEGMGQLPNLGREDWHKGRLF